MKDQRPEGCFDGYLFARLHAIGTRSEGPQYYLQRWDYREERVIKNAPKDEEDTSLHGHVGQKVRLRGRRYAEGIHYHEISVLDNIDEGIHFDENDLELTLTLDTIKVYVNANLPDQGHGRVLHYLDMTMSVEWLGNGEWRGLCPTTQIYDFSIWHDGREIWRWSDGRSFSDVVTPVHVPWEEPVKYVVTWYFSPHQIESEGSYRARATFIASGQSREQEFEIIFLH